MNIKLENNFNLLPCINMKIMHRLFFRLILLLSNNGKSKKRAFLHINKCIFRQTKIKKKILCIFVAKISYIYILKHFLLIDQKRKNIKYYQA